MHLTKTSVSNAARVAGVTPREAVESKSDLAVPRSGPEYSKLLGLQSSISDASDLDKPNSKCQSAMNELVGLAIRPGPTGHNARTALVDVFTQDIGPEKRQAILNTCQARTGGTVDLSVTVAFMAACAPLPPLGENGPGHVDANLAHVARNLPPELQREPDLLAPNRAITSAELLAAGANLENLNVWDRPISMTTPSAKEEFEALGHQALRQIKSGAVWVPGSAGHHMAVVAEPVSDGIRFHVIARPGDEQALEVAKALKGLSFGDPCIVTSHEVEHPHLALEHLNANDGDVRGAGGVIREHADHWSSLSTDDRQAITLASQATLFETVAASGTQSTEHAPTATPEVPVPLARPKSLEDKAIGLKPSTVATPATAQNRPAIEVDVTTNSQSGPTAKAETTVPVSVAAPVLTRAELKAMASAGGFVRDKITERPTNVWFDISDTMNVHMATTTAGFLERRRLSDDVERRLNEMPDSNKRLTTAVMKAGPVPLSLGRSPLWAHLDKVRDAGSGPRVYVTASALLAGADSVGQAQALLSGKGQALVAISAQVLARLALLSTEITKAAALVTSKDPNDGRHRQFKESLLELQNWLGREVAKIDEAVSELDAVLAPNAKDVTRGMRADANTLRKACVALQSEFKDPAGVVQQAIGFTRAALASPENLQQAADALIV